MLTEMIKRSEKEYNKRKKREEFKRKLTLLKAKLLNKGISPDDTRTIQAHISSNEHLKDYYIKNSYLQDGSNYVCVSAIKEDIENNRFVYRGMLSGADNATGVIESNVPLSEIVGSYSGNTIFQKVISKENAEKRRDEYYSKIGEPQERLKGHMTHFGKTDFVVGTILKGKNGKFTYSSEVSQDVEQFLSDEREEDKRKQLMRNKESIEVDIGGGIVVSKQNCWLEQGKKINFAGINMEALYYRFEPEEVMKTDDNKYAYIGSVQIGEQKKIKKDDAPIQFVTPFEYGDVVLWTDGKNLTEYFLNKKLAGLNLSLGEIVTVGNLNKENDQEGQLFIGGITLDEQGKCKSTKDIPETVREAIKEYIKNRQQEKTSKIIKFDSYSDNSSR